MMGDRSSERKESALRHLVQLRLERVTFQEAARQLGVSVRTAKRWAASAAYKRVFGEMKSSWDESARAQVKMAADIALVTLIEICQSEGVSPYAKVQAAKTLGEWAGLGRERCDDDGGDDRDELQRVLLLAQQRTVQPGQPAV